MVSDLLSFDVGASERPLRRTRYSGLSAQEINLKLRAHTAGRAMAFFDRLSPEDREKVREGGTFRAYDWQLQERDSLGRFKASAV